MATPQVITYGYIRGRWYAFPDTNSAREAVVKYNGNYQSIRLSRPVGAVIDEETLVNRSFWPPSLANAPGVTGSALINPPYNPIQGPTPVTPEVEETVTETVVETPNITTSSAPKKSGNGGEQGTDYYGGPKRTTGKYLAGTKILQSEVNANLRANSGDAKYWEERLKNTDNPNDVLFEMAFRMGEPKYTASGDITGQGNKFVGKLQSGQYKMKTGPTWAQQAVAGDSGATDVYRQKDAEGNVKSFTTGAEFAQQFKHGEWEPGDFGKDPKKKADAQAWRDRHLLHAESGLGSYAGLSAQEKIDKKNRIAERYERMIRGDR